jgi:hypothetical protein
MVLPMRWTQSPRLVDSSRITGSLHVQHDVAEQVAMVAVYRYSALSCTRRCIGRREMDIPPSDLGQVESMVGALTHGKERWMAVSSNTFITKG